MLKGKERKGEMGKKSGEAQQLFGVEIIMVSACLRIGQKEPAKRSPFPNHLEKMNIFEWRWGP
jgi:hypothetical protein